MAELKQEERLIGVTTPLGENVVVLGSFTGREEISRLFSFHLELVSHERSIQANQLIGRNVTFWVKKGDGEKQYFNGFIRRFSLGLWNGVFRRYRVEVVPWLWFLTQTTDCRIFQEKSVPDIVEQVFKDLGYTDYELSLQGDHPAREYCVQYRESDFNFVSRLLEEEGIFYFFKHENGKHVLHLCDTADAYKDCMDGPIAYPYDLGTRRLADVLTGWEHQFEFRTGAWAQTDFDFKRPSFDLMTTAKTSGNYGEEPKFEAYDYPGQYVDKPYGQNLTDMRMEEDEAPRDLVAGTSTCTGFSPGGRFEIERHYADEEEGQKYVITSVRHVGNEPSAYSSGGAAPEPDYNNRFTCIPADVLFRPARVTPVPVMQGTQTAIVVGPAGEEVYTDEYGRIKVQFHWDREGQYDENSSCWMRVSQTWAGKRWGAFFLPRIGQEVIVDFLEGDPDKPIVIGSVYNGEQRHPYLGDGLDSAHQHDPHLTGVKSNSTKGGEGYNEWRFDDTKDSEQIFIHAERDFDLRILNDSREWVGGDRHEIIGEEDKDGQQGDLRQTVHQDKHLNIKRDHIEHIERHMQLKVDKNLDIEIGEKQTEKIGQGFDLEVAGDVKEKYSGNHSLEVGGDQHHKVNGRIAIQAGSNGEIHLKAGTKIIIEAGSQVTLKGPGGFVDISSSGVTIQGDMVKINSGGEAGSGEGVSPESPDSPEQAAPDEPDQADDSVTGLVSAPS